MTECSNNPLGMDCMLHVTLGELARTPKRMALPEGHPCQRREATTPGWSQPVPPGSITHKPDPLCAKTGPTRGCGVFAKLYLRKGSNCWGKERCHSGEAQAGAYMTLEQRRETPRQEGHWRKRGHKRRYLRWTTTTRYASRPAAG